jgi:hypothetical protein
MNKINLILLVMFLSCLNSCSTTKHTILDTKILKKEKLNKKEYIVNKIILIEENEMFLIGYNCRVINGLVPIFIDGKKFKLVLKTGDDLFFLNEDETYNIKILNQFKGSLQDIEAKEKVDTFITDYKKGYVIME